MAKRAMTPAERQARWRERHLESDDGGKEELHLVLAAGTKKRLQKIAERRGDRSITALIEQFARQPKEPTARPTNRTAPPC
jgi:hypothetical protein